MANTANDVLAKARADIGYCRWDDPQAGTKYGRWYADLVNASYYGTSGVPFCAMAVSYWFAQAGATCAGIPEAYCPYILNKARSAGAILSDKTKAQPGDVVLFNWDGGVVDHVGIVEKNLGSYIQTIEGNTTINGRSGSVGRRTRSWGTVAAVIRPSYGGSSGTTSGGTSTGASGTRLKVDGYIGKDSTTEWQTQLGTVPDGYIDGQDKSNKKHFPNLTSVRYGSGGSPMVKALQRFLESKGYSVGKSGIDGHLGYDTVIALQKWMTDELGYKKHGIDGILGINTAANVQNALNIGAFKS